MNDLKMMSDAELDKLSLSLVTRGDSQSMDLHDKVIWEKIRRRKAETKLAQRKAKRLAAGGTWHDATA